MISAGSPSVHGFDPSVLASADLADEHIATEIRLLGRRRLERGEQIELEEFLRTVPGIADRPACLDAAIDIALRSLSGSARPTPEAVRTLIEAHPAFERAIRTAASLADALWSTESGHVPGHARSLPFAFGPTIADGLPRYTLEELLGVGSSGAVYRAIDRSLSVGGHESRVAVKILHAGRDDALTRARFMEEASKARLLDHANAVRVFDRGESRDSEQYIVYELVEGGDLHSWVVGQAGRVSPAAAARMAERIAEAIQGAHSVGLVHLDLKPANVLVTADGQPKVADFGLSVRDAGESRAATPDRSMGTLAFMPPEQFRGDPGWAAPPADIYALGGVLLWILTGAAPNGGSREDILRAFDDPSGAAAAARLRAVAAPRGLDRDLLAICIRALAPSRSERYTTAAELAADLRAWRERRPIAWTRPSPVRIATLFARRRPALAVLVLASLSSLVGALIASERARIAADARARAEAVAAREHERATENTAWRINAQQHLGNLASAILNKPRKSGFSTDILEEIWLAETIFGPEMIASVDDLTKVRDARIHVLREVYERNLAAYGATALKTLMSQTALAFVLARAERLEEARIVIEDNAARCARVLEPGDPWLADVEIIRQCVDAGLRVAALDGRPPLGDLRQELIDVEGQLRAHFESLKPRADGRQLQLLLLTRLRELYSPVCFNNAKWEKWAVDSLIFFGEDPIENRAATAEAQDTAD